MLRRNLRKVHELIVAGHIKAAGAVKDGGIAAAVTVMGLGNGLGLDFVKPYPDTTGLFTLQPGGMVLEFAADADVAALLGDVEYLLLGKLNQTGDIDINDTRIAAAELLPAYTETLEKIFPSAYFYQYF